MLTGFILFHWDLNLSSLHHWWLHRTFCIDATSITILLESWSTCLGYVILGSYSPYWKKLLEMVSQGWHTDTEHKKHLVHCVLNVCLWNWRPYIVNAFIFSGRLQWKNFLLYTWLFSMSRVKTTRIRSGEHGGLQFPACYCVNRNTVNSAQSFLLCELLHCVAKKERDWFSHNWTNDQEMVL